MSLTPAQRAALQADQFAFPRTRNCPIHDAKHVKLAWGMVENVQGVTTAERADARVRIMAAAESYGVDHAELPIKKLDFVIDNLSAMALDIPQVDGHPNRYPFSGVMTRVDTPSDLAPHGSFGKKVLLPSAVAEAALPSLAGMAIDYKDDLSGHDKKSKIGVITAAHIEGDAINISGFFYSNDFPDEVETIVKHQDLLGFSFEAERVLVSDVGQDPIRIESLVFTGAAVMQKKKAAYQSTSLAAAAEEKAMEKEQFDALMKSITDLGERVGKIEAGGIQAASVADKVEVHAKALKDCATGMEAAGVGAHPTRGHVHVLRHMADNLMAEAHQGKIAAEYHAPSMYAAAQPTELSVAAQAEIKAIKDGLASVQTILKDDQAKASLGGAPERKTLPARISSLMAKGAISLPEDGSKMTVAKLDTVLKGTSLSPQDRIEIKTGLERAGLLETK